MNYSEIVAKYNNAGLACLPTKENKSPLLPENWKEGFAPEMFTDCFGIGIICGQISGGLECQDWDNHANEAKENLSKYLSIPDVKEVYEKHKMPIEETMSGGYHLLYRCEKIDGNRKLASKLLNGKPDCFCETRGESGYFVAAPTPKYNIIRNDILNIPTITEFERAILIDSAISMNEYVKPIITEYENSERPGDIYNNDPSSIYETIQILKDEGWTDFGHGNWCRPGKNTGISATLGKAAPNIFYVFTSNGYPFDEMKGYTSFQVLGLLKFKGDFKEAAQSLPQPESKKTEYKGSISKSEIEKILERIKIDPKKTIEKPPTILSIKDTDIYHPVPKRLFSLGNFSAIIGKAKSKKTYLITLLTSALLKTQEYEEFLTSSMPDNKKMIVWFDTEQADYDTQIVAKRVITLSNTDKNFTVFNLREFTPLERCQIIEYVFELTGDKIGFCIIDGIADLANAINDEIEATRVTSLLLRLTKNYNTHITTVIHQNKNDNFATGHLGSSILKKAEIIISVTKNSEMNSNSVVKCDMSRAIDFKDWSFTIDKSGLPIIDNELYEPKIANPYDKDDSEAPF